MIGQLAVYYTRRKAIKKCDILQPPLAETFRIEYVHWLYGSSI